MKFRLSIIAAVLCLSIMIPDVCLGAGQELAMPEPAWLHRMLQDGWRKVQQGVLQRDTGGGRVETFTYGQGGLLWTAQKLQERISSLQREYAQHPSAELARVIASLKSESTETDLSLSTAQVDAFAGEAATAGCEPTFGVHAAADPLMESQGVTASADASYNSPCSDLGNVYSYAYARAKSGTTTAVRIEEDPQFDGTSLASAVTVSVNGSLDCYSEAYARAWSPALNLSYETSDTNFSCPPVAKFTFTCAGLACTFNAGGSTADQGIASYSWNFGDSTSFCCAVTTSHTYTATGSYTVTLTVTDTSGLQSSTSRKISVSSEVPGAAEGFFTVPPCRLADTRTTTPLTSGVQQAFQVTGLCGIPATAKAVSFNVTIVSPTGQGFLVFFPGNQTSGPFAQSSINFNPAIAPRSNNAILRLATNDAGTINVFPSVTGSPGQVHMILDVDSYFSEDAVPASGAQGPYGFQSVLPCRVADTRTSTAITANTTRDFIVQGLCGVPAGAAAAALNTVIIKPSANGSATLFQAGAFPPVSTINFNAGAVLANGTRTQLAPTTPDISLYYFSPITEASTHALVDVYGYFKSDAPLKYRPIIACRTVDTRFADQGGPGLGSGETRNFQIRGNCGVPASAKAVAVNVATTNQAGQGFLYVHPSGSAVPGASYINFSSGQGPLSNGGIVALSTLPNDLAITASNGTNVLVDVYGYFE